MVLTRLSHVGEVCPLSDHSYSDPVTPSTNPHSSNRRNNALTATKQVPESEGESTTAPTILNLPSELIEKIFSYTTYKNIGDLRRVCKRFAMIGANMLNTAFQRLQSQMLQRFQDTKAKMPRRESARRKHPLARESDILETLHMRLSLLQMAFGKHIERKHCCFFAGEILDEVYKIINCMKQTPYFGKVCKVTDELFDLSEMAMEYFKEHIEPTLPEITYFGSDFLGVTRFGDGSSSNDGDRISEQEDELDRESLPASNMVLRKRIRRIRQGMKRYNTQLTAMKRELKACKSKVTDQNKQMLAHTVRFEEYDKKLEESSKKFSQVLQELNKCKTELQYWRSRSPLCCSCGRGISESHSLLGAGSALYPGCMGSKHHVPNFLPSITSTVRNLEPLFEFSSSLKASKHSFPFESGLDFVREGSLHFHPPLSLEKHHSEDDDLNFVQGIKHAASDDDSETDDTVGKRVKERKRVKLEAL